MITIHISDEVWNEIYKRGRLRETEEDVLRRVFNLKPLGKVTILEEIKPHSPRPRPRYAEHKMSARLVHGVLTVWFPEKNNQGKWPLSFSKDDRGSIRKTLDEAIDFAEQNGASLGQINAIRKTLTDNGYHLMGPHKRLSRF